MLAGKAVIIGCAGRGIGAACAMGIARHGAIIVVNDVDSHGAYETVRAITAEGGASLCCVTAAYR